MFTSKLPRTFAIVASSYCSCSAYSYKISSFMNSKNMKKDINENKDNTLNL